MKSKKRPPGEIFNYSNIFFSFYLEDGHMCSSMSPSHKLIYLYSGEIIFYDKGQEIMVQKGECVFLRKDTHVKMFKQPKNGEQFKTIFMEFDRNFLRQFYRTISKKDLPLEIQQGASSVLKFPDRPELNSLFHSLTPYFDTTIQPSSKVIELKLLEAVYFLLSVDEKFYPVLFDFTQPWKIDILDFLNDNFRLDLSMQEIANFTGRSLSTFKRDFKKISNLSPQKWLINRRLEEAHQIINQENKKIQDVCHEVGFKNLSHFSRIYKERYGNAPTK